MTKHQNDDDNNDVVFEDTAPEESERVDLQSKIKSLKEELGGVREDMRKQLDDFQRAKADFINMRKRDKESSEDFLKYAKESVIADLLPVLDSFDMAFGNKEAWEKAPPDWRMGVEYIYKQLISVVEAHGISQYEPEGKTFDPNEHDAIETEKTEAEKDDHKIIKVIQKGYKLNGKLIRPAKVKILVFEK